MKPWYAGNARQLLQERQRGNVPYGPVVVEMTGGAWDVTTLHLDDTLPVDKADWRMLVNLDVWIFANPKTALERLTETALRIAMVRPKSLIVRFEAGSAIHDVHVGDGFHQVPPAPLDPMHFFSVAIINCSGTKTGALMRNALKNKFQGIQAL